MVFGFLCHSVGSPCRMLYSAVFGDDLQLAVNEVCLISIPVSASRHKLNVERGILG